MLPEHWVDQRPCTVVAPPRAPWLRAARSLAEVLFASAAGPPPAARLNWLCVELDRFLEHAGPQAKLTFLAGLTAVTSLAPVLVGGPPVLGALALERRAHALERFERTPLGIALFAVKAILCMLYYEHPDAAREMGFDGACLEDEA